MQNEHKYRKDAIAKIKEYVESETSAIEVVLHVSNILSELSILLDEKYQNEHKGLFELQTFQYLKRYN